MGLKGFNQLAPKVLNKAIYWGSIRRCFRQLAKT